MHRRGCLVGLAGALAGCVEFDSSREREPFDVGEPVDVGRTGSTDSDGPTDARVDERRVAVFDGVDRTVAVSPVRHRTERDATVAVWFTEPATTDGPARLWTAIENDSGGWRRLDLGETPFGGSPLVEPGGGNRLYLAPAPDHELAEASPEYEYVRGSWQLVEESWRLADGPADWFPSSVGLEDGERREGECLLLGTPDTNGLPMGRYATAGNRLELIVWRTSQPGPAVDSRFDHGSLPALSTSGVSSVVSTIEWYHEANPRTAVHVEPEPEYGDPPAELSFRLVNRSRAAGRGNGWTLYGLADGEWHPITSAVVGSILRSIQPGERPSWTLAAYPGAVPDDERADVVGRTGLEGVRTDDAGRRSGDGSRDGDGDGSRDGDGDGDDGDDSTGGDGDGEEGDGPDESRTAIPYLGGRTYAIVPRYLFEDGMTFVGAAFELGGEPPELSPTDDTRAVDDGGTVVVRTDRGDDVETPRLLTLEPADDATLVLLPELVMQPDRRALCNALAFRDDGEQVVVETDGGAVRRALDGRGSVRFRFDGRAYEARSESAR